MTYQFLFQNRISKNPCLHIHLNLCNLVVENLSSLILINTYVGIIHSNNHRANNSHGVRYFVTVLCIVQSWSCKHYKKFSSMYINFWRSFVSPMLFFQGYSWTNFLSKFRFFTYGFSFV